MFYLLLLTFLGGPALENSLFILLSGYIGSWWVFNNNKVTGIIRCGVAKKKGSEALKKVRQSMQAGVPPGDHILDGITILIAGIVLFIPGFFTDVIGFILLISFTR